jgi:hypothetical protein
MSYSIDSAIDSKDAVLRRNRGCYRLSILHRIFCGDGVDGYIDKPGFRFTPVTFVQEWKL